VHPGNLTLYRVTLWQAKNPKVKRIIYASCSDVDEVTLCAWEWLCWSREKRPRGLPSYSRYRVEAPADNNEYKIIEEGTAEDAAQKLQCVTVRSTTSSDTEQNRRPQRSPRPQRATADIVAPQGFRSRLREMITTAKSKQ
jgi:hypothetical protein